MNLETRKIQLMQEFLKLQSEEVIFKIEKLLKIDKANKPKVVLPLTREELQQRIALSESDFENNRYKSSEELISKFV